MCQILSHILAYFSRLLLLAALSLLTEAAQYVPGEPGAKWTLDEALIVKAKLWSIMGKNGGPNALRRIYGKQIFGPDVPKAPKFIRLGFHDCLK